MADKFGLRTWTINLRTWIFGFTCLVFKTTCIDRGKPLREGAFLFTRRTLFPPLDKRNTRDKAKGLYITSERHIGELGVRCLSTINRELDSAATVSYRSAPPYEGGAQLAHGHKKKLAPADGCQLLYDNKEGARCALSLVTLEESAGEVLADHRQAHELVSGQ